MVAMGKKNKITSTQPWATTIRGINFFKMKLRNYERKGLVHTPARGSNHVSFYLRDARYATRLAGRLYVILDKLNLVNPFARDVTIFQAGARFFESQVKHASISHPNAFAPTPRV